MDAEKIRNLFHRITPELMIELAVVVAVALALAWLIQRMLPLLAARLHGKRRHWVLALIPTLRILVVAVALGWIVSLLIEPSLRNMVAILGAVGLALGFALKDYVSSLFAGVVAAYERPYRPGDWIEVDGCYGEVRHIGLRAVEMVTPDDTVVIVPHLKLWDGLIRNANNGGASLMCVASFYLAPEHDAYEVQRVLHDVALSSPYLKLGRPVVVVMEDHPWGSRYRIKAYPMDPRQQFLFISDLTARGKALLHGMGVEFARVEAMSGSGNNNAG
ncbi:mechanosensitive ion channel family protein [Oceanimonas baumannii]|uniref:Small-conductance mechanosensitive channel n=1 Tax=Oceanimonas baumannii TaxID=129578 RepID=A0A235CFJ1_9GAMM|nr:mechanosensitive ion channel domain-containing protein [Oceanimonas baumannii]MCC4263073.1 mechanosensitive ion channel family protein [Oceanimonas baumannii]OYD23134.1 mechanosensitive ion channel protein MscS [Oceanimonas baumannii]TDW58406.1 small-conductance mechanosensitive channel [Oceanimonas baumannii]